MSASRLTFIFEFLRNTDLDARGYFDPTRSVFRQNQFGGTAHQQRTNRLRNPNRAEHRCSNHLFQRKLWREHSGQLHRQLQLQRSRNDASLSAQRIAISAELRLREVHRSGFKPRRATRSERPARYTRHLGLDQKHSFEASYTWAIPFAALLHQSNRLTTGWSLSGATRLATGFPVTFFDNSDNSLLGTLGNGVNNYLLDTPAFQPGRLHINTNGRNGKPAFNTALFSEETLGQLGNAKRRMFHGPGIENFDMTAGERRSFYRVAAGGVAL